MAIKVKGDKIKENSIPLNALSEEVQNKLNEVVTPDWDAKENEAGFIKNKPFSYIGEYNWSLKGIQTVPLGEKWKIGESVGLKINISYPWNYGPEEFEVKTIIPSNPNNFEVFRVSMGYELEFVIYANLTAEKSVNGVTLTAVTFSDRYYSQNDEFECTINYKHVNKVSEAFIPDEIARVKDVQEKLVSGVNVATINGKDILKGGNVDFKYLPKVDLSEKVDYFEILTNGYKEWTDGTDDLSLVARGLIDEVVIGASTYISPIDKQITKISMLRETTYLCDDNTKVSIFSTMIDPPQKEYFVFKTKNDDYYDGNVRISHLNN